MEIFYLHSDNKKQAKEELEKIISMPSASEYVFCALFEIDTNTFIGEAGIISFNKNANRCVVGYNLLPWFWNKGYATMGLQKVTILPNELKNSKNCSLFIL